MDIVGYTFQAANYCPGCIEGAYGDNTFSATMFPEDALDALAALAGIDRMDEHSYDSDEFPKVIFRDSVESEETCHDCLAPL